MHRNEYRRMAHEEVEEIFREILPQAGMKVREEQITLCHQMLSSLWENKIKFLDVAVGVGKTYAYLVACILFRKYSQLLSGYFSINLLNSFTASLAFPFIKLSLVSEEVNLKI